MFSRQTKEEAGGRNTSNGLLVRWGCGWSGSLRLRVVTLSTSDCRRFLGTRLLWAVWSGGWTVQMWTVALAVSRRALFDLDLARRLVVSRYSNRESLLPSRLGCQERSVELAMVVMGHLMVPGRRL